MSHLRLGPTVTTTVKESLVDRFSAHWKQLWFGALPKVDGLSGLSKFKLDEPLTNNALDLFDMLGPLNKLCASCTRENFVFGTGSYNLHCVALVISIHTLLADLGGLDLADDKVERYLNVVSSLGAITQSGSLWRPFLGEPLYAKFTKVTELFSSIVKSCKEQFLKNARSNVDAVCIKLTKELQNENLQKFIELSNGESLTMSILKEDASAVLVLDPDPKGPSLLFGSAYFACVDAIAAQADVCKRLAVEVTIPAEFEIAKVAFAALSSAQCLLKPLEGPRAGHRDALVRELCGLADLSVLPETFKKLLREVCSDFDQHVGAFAVGKTND